MQDLQTTAPMPNPQAVRPSPEMVRQVLGQPVTVEEAAATKRQALMIKIVAVAAFVALVGLAFGLRLAQNDRQGAYLDEAGQILAGRYLFEQPNGYANILEWSYGSYLWPIVAASADKLGGLQMVRLTAALFGAIMTLATALTAAWLAPFGLRRRTRWIAGWVAGLIMAIMPTAIGLGRFGTYDGLAGVGLMSGVACLAAMRFYTLGDKIGTRLWLRRGLLLAAALFMFVGFLAKYVLAIYFPFICLFLMFGLRRYRPFLMHTAWFVLPLASACVVYFAAFHADLLRLLSFSTGYTDLKSKDPFVQYVAERPEIFLLAGLALLFGWQKAGNVGRLVAVVGTGLILLFQAGSRADYDYWKHSLYVIFFLAPLVGLAAGEGLEKLMTRPTSTGRRFTASRVGAVALVMLIVVGIVTPVVENNSYLLTSFYPNLKPSLSQVQTYTTDTKTVLTDDPALRYYLYPRILSERVTDPFYFAYKGKLETAAYEQAVTDRYFDTIIFDGGIGPIGTQLRKDLNPLLQKNYQPVYTAENGAGGKIEIFKPITCAPLDTPAGAQIYNFNDGVGKWGVRADQADLQPGQGVSTSRVQICNGAASLEFEPKTGASQIGLGLKAPVSEVKAQIFIQPNASVKPNTPGVPVGMVGFDSNWGWHDDGFKQLVPTGRWVEISWKLDAPGLYNEIGLSFPDGTQTVYISSVVIVP